MAAISHTWLMATVLDNTVLEELMAGKLICEGQSEGSAN